MVPSNICEVEAGGLWSECTCGDEPCGHARLCAIPSMGGETSACPLLLGQFSMPRLSQACGKTVVPDTSFRYKLLVMDPATSTEQL